MDINIRVASESDFAAICGVLEEGDALHRTALPDVFQPTNEEIRPRDFFLARMRGPDSVVLIACEAEFVRGVAEVVMKKVESRVMTRARRYGVLDNLVVATTHRRRGIGKRLVAESICWAKERGARQIELNVWEFNQGAIAMYDRLGFETLRQTMGIRLD